MEATYKLIPGIILQQNGAVSAGVSVGDETTITYDAQGFFDLIAMQPVSEKVTNFAPTRRMSQGAKIVVAQAGDPCTIVMLNGVRFLHVTEGIKFKEACP